MRRPLSLFTVLKRVVIVGLVNPKCTGIIGNGVVVHVPSFFVELEALEKEGASVYQSHWYHIV